MQQLNELVAALRDWVEPVMARLVEADALIQLAIVGVLFVPALLLSRLVEPRLEAAARRIKGMKGLGELGTFNVKFHQLQIFPNNSIMSQISV